MKHPTSSVHFFLSKEGGFWLLLYIGLFPTFVASLSMTPVANGKNSKFSLKSVDQLASYYSHTPITTAGDWHRFCPPLWPTKKRPVDVTVTWKRSDSNATVAAATAMIREMDPHLPPTETMAYADILSSYLLSFSDFCQEHFKKCPEFKARIVASRGSSGTKCPQWHIDHVPVRWIQALAGPGCDFLPNDDGVNWAAVNALDDTLDRVGSRNRLLVNTDVANIYAAKEGEAILLAGNRWSELCKDKFQSRCNKPIVHRSPVSIRKWQSRLLLTQDVIFDQA